MDLVYLDHAATTPVLPEVAEAALPFWTTAFGNPSSVHAAGRKVRSAIERARGHAAALIGADAEELIFTSGGTESCNMAVLGAARALRGSGDHIITTRVEHHAVLDACAALEKEGFRVTYLPVDQHGRVDPAAVTAAFDNQTILVSVMLANNEVGTIQPVAEIARAAAECGILVHTDAVQAVGLLDVDVRSLAVDLLSFSGHKIYAPKGIGALFVRRGVRKRLQALLYGGGQEGRLRPGTENTAGIAALGKAAEIALRDRARLAKSLAALRDQLQAGLVDRIPDLQVNGDPDQRLPNNVNVSIAGVESETLLIQLDMAGLAASSGSACTAGSVEPSHVLQAMGATRTEAMGALRLTLGRSNEIEHIDPAVDQIAGTVERIRAIRTAGAPRRK